jgi:hypothetical protein
MDIALPLEKKTHRDGSDATVKGYTTTLKESVRAIRATTQKAN